MRTTGRAGRSRRSRDDAPLNKWSSSRKGGLFALSARSERVAPDRVRRRPHPLGRHLLGDEQIRIPGRSGGGVSKCSGLRPSLAIHGGPIQPGLGPVIAEPLAGC